MPSSFAPSLRPADVRGGGREGGAIGCPSPAAADPALIDFLTALALVFVIEGLLYAIAPGSMRDMAVRITGTETALLRRVGLGAAVLGVLALAAIRG